MDRYAELVKISQPNIELVQDAKTGIILQDPANDPVAAKTRCVPVLGRVAGWWGVGVVVGGWLGG